MSSKSYFLFVSSNDCREIYPANNPASFCVDLPIPLSLPGIWEIGILDFSMEAEFLQIPKEMYICLNILDSSYVQGSLIKAIQRISIPSHFSEKIMFSFPRINYVSVISNYLNYFQVKILSENLQEAAFKKGNLYFTLHLKKC